MAEQTPRFDPMRPPNSVMAAAGYFRVSGGLACERARSGAWPGLRVGSRLLVKTRPFMAMKAGALREDAAPRRPPAAASA